MGKNQVYILAVTFHRPAISGVEALLLEDLCLLWLDILGEGRAGQA
jgi:hypothetical protein